jgi:hypothetical protein
MTWADLAEWAQFNKDFLSDVQAAKKAGKSVDEVAASWKIPEKYAAKGYVTNTNPDTGRQRLKDNVTNLYKEIK